MGKRSDVKDREIISDPGIYNSPRVCIEFIMGLQFILD